MQYQYIVIYLHQQKGKEIMTTLDLTNNRDRIIKKIKSQISLATSENIKSVMNKIVAMLPQFESEKATMSNIDKLTMKATLSYIKNGMVANASQKQSFEIRREEKLKEMYLNA